jgi:hypothetical protein
VARLVFRQGYARLLESKPCATDGFSIVQGRPPSACSTCSSSSAQAVSRSGTCRPRREERSGHKGQKASPGKDQGACRQVRCRHRRSRAGSGLASPDQSFVPFSHGACCADGQRWGRGTVRLSTTASAIPHAWGGSECAGAPKCHPPGLLQLVGGRHRVCFRVGKNHQHASGGLTLLRSWDAAFFDLQRQVDELFEERHSSLIPTVRWRPLRVKDTALARLWQRVPAGRLSLRPHARSGRVPAARMQMLPVNNRARLQRRDPGFRNLANLFSARHDCGPGGILFPGLPAPGL